MVKIVNVTDCPNDLYHISALACHYYNGPISINFINAGFQGELSEHTVPKYLHNIPDEDLVALGHTLGLRYNKLRRFKSTENFCLNLVSAWLREEDEVSERSGKPSWESLAKALEEIGQNGKARTIRDDNIIANHQLFITTSV